MGKRSLNSGSEVLSIPRAEPDVAAKKHLSRAVTGIVQVMKRGHHGAAAHLTNILNAINWLDEVGKPGAVNGEQPDASA